MTKRILILSFLLVFSTILLQAQTTLFGYVKDNQGNIIENADVDLVGTDLRVKTDKIGYFQFVDIQNETYRLVVSKIGFDTNSIEVTITNEKRKDMGIIQLATTSETSDIGVTILDDASADDDGSLMQPTIGLLNSGRDAFSRTAAFELGAYWFRPRGIDNRYSDVLFNGITMSKNSDGKVNFSNWGGLNDITRYPYEITDNIAPSDYIFGNIGGVVYYNTRASNFRKQASVAYSFTNRSYDHRLMLTYSSGLSKNGWAFTFSGSRRWAKEGVIDGTYQDSYAYFGAIEKKLGSKHSLNFTAFGTPTYRASNSPNTQEVYDLMGKDYNSYWGWQNGEKRNERVRKTFEPIFQLSHYWKIGKKANLNSTASYQFGSDKRGRLDWFNAANPSPTYYRNLPSYQWAPATYPNSAGGFSITDDEYATYNSLYQQAVNNWKNGVTKTQIDWNGLIQQNYNQNQRGASAAYYTIQDVNDDKTFNFNLHFDTFMRHNWKLNINVNYQNFQSDNYRKINDLLGANYAMNIDDFDQDGLGYQRQYNVDDVETKVYQNDRIEYSYVLHRDTYTANISTNVKFNRWNITTSVFMGYNESFRDGKYRHYLYLNDSKGKSITYKSSDYGIKSRVEYLLNGKNFIVYNGAIYSLAPTLNEIFANPRLSNLITPDLKNQIINSNDLSFIHRGQLLKLRATGYYNTIFNFTKIFRYYAQGVAEITETSVTSKNVFISEILSNAKKEYIGGELGAEIKISPTFTVNAVAAYGQYVYKNNPNVYLTSDRLKGVQNFGPAYIKNYKIAGTPQQGYSLGLRYNSPKYWWIGITGNLLAKNYLDFSSLPRTANFIYRVGSNIPYDNINEQNVRTLLKQTKFDDQFMLNASIGKSFLIGKYRMGLSLVVNNILNNRNYVTGGFEQGRNANFEDAYSDFLRPIRLFSPKLWYDIGVSYFANVYLKF